MTKFAIKKYNYDYLDSNESMDYEQSSSVIYKIYDSLEEAEKDIISLEREGINDINLEARKEWYELSNEEILALSEFIESCGQEIPVRDNDGKLEFSMAYVKFCQLSDEQLNKFLELGAGGMYYVTKFKETYQQGVVYTNDGGYLREDPHGYSQSFINISSLSELSEIVSNYSLYWGKNVLYHTIELTENDITCQKFQTLLEKYKESVKTEINQDKKGYLTFINESDYECMEDFNNVVENPSFLIHQATNLEMMQIENDSYTLLEKYKFSGRKL